MGLFDKFKKVFSKKEKEEVEVYDKGLEKTRKEFVNKISILNSKYKKVSSEYFDELEEILIMADIGVDTVMNFIDRLKKRVKKENIVDSEDLREIIVDEMFIIYVNNEIVVNKINYNNNGPTVILFVSLLSTISFVGVVSVVDGCSSFLFFNINKRITNKRIATTTNNIIITSYIINNIFILIISEL